MWVVFAAALTIVAVLAGFAVGCLGKSRRRPARWAYTAGYLTYAALLIAGGVFQERMHIPYAPRLLAEAGHAGIVLVASLTLIAITAMMAGRLAKRVAG